MSVRNNDGLEEKKELPAQGTQVESTDSWIARLQEAPFCFPKEVLDELEGYYLEEDFEKLYDFLHENKFGFAEWLLKLFNFSPLLFLPFSSKPPEVYMHLYEDMDVESEHNRKLACATLINSFVANNLRVVECLIDRLEDEEFVNFLAGAPLLFVLDSGHLDLLKLLLEKGVDANELDYDDQTPLFKACMAGRLDMVELLIAYGADVNYKYGMFGVLTPLFVACRNGSFDIVKFLIDHGVEVNSEVPGHEFPLLVAYQGGHIDIMKFLIAHGADVNRVFSCKTLLHIACEDGRLDVVQFLVESGAEIKAPLQKSTLINLESVDSCPITLAYRNGHLDIVDYLVEVVDSAKNLYSLMEVLEAAVNKGDVDMVTKVLPHIKPNYSTKYSFERKSFVELLRTACFLGDLDIARVLIDQMELSLVNFADGEFLFSLYEKGHFNVVGFFIENGADVNKIYRNGSTLLNLACSDSRLDLVQWMLGNGADVNQADRFGRTPFFLACKEGLVEVAETLIAYGADINMPGRNSMTPLWMASYNGHFNIVKLLLDHDVVVEEVDTSNMSRDDDIAYLKDPFMYSCVKGRFDLVKLWLEYGMDVNQAVRRGETPFWVACSRGHLDIVQLMFEEYGADMTQVDDYGRTPLHAACEYGHFDVAQYLLDHGANPHTKNNVGRTALWSPIFHEDWSLVELFIDRMGFAEKHGFDKDLLLKRCHVNIHSSELMYSGDPLLIANMKNHVDVMTLLAEHGADIRSNDKVRINSVKGTIKMMREFYQNIRVLDDVSVSESKEEEIGGIDGCNVEELQQSVERCQILLSALTYVSEDSEDAAFKDKVASLHNDFYVSYLLLATLDIVDNQEIIHECLGHITAIPDEATALEIASSFYFHENEAIGRSFFWRLAQKVDFDMDNLVVFYSGLMTDKVGMTLDEKIILQSAYDYLFESTSACLFSKNNVTFFENQVKENSLIEHRHDSAEAQHAYDKHFGIMPV